MIVTDGMSESLILASPCMMLEATMYQQLVDISAAPQVRQVDERIETFQDNTFTDRVCYFAARDKHP